MKAEDRTRRWLEDLGSQVFPHVLTRRTDIPLNLGFQELSPGLLTLAPTLFSLDDQDGAVLRQDLSLGRLVEAGEEGLQLSASLGFGWSLSWRNLPYSLVNTATARMALFGEPSSEAFQMELAYCLDEFRRLLAGLRGHALVVSGLDGIELMHDSWLQTPWGRIKICVTNGTAHFRQRESSDCDPGERGTRDAFNRVGHGELRHRVLVDERTRPIPPRPFVSARWPHHW